MTDFKVSIVEAIVTKWAEHLANLSPNPCPKFEPTPAAKLNNPARGEVEKESEDSLKDLSPAKSQGAPIGN